MRRFYMTLEEKRAILNSFNQLIEVKEDGTGYSYYMDNDEEFRLIARDFNDAGDGYVYDQNKWVNVRDFSARDFRELLHKNVDSQMM